MPQWIDVHAHLNMLESEVEETLERCKSAGIEKVITIGTEPEDHAFVLSAAEKYFPRVYCTLGVHPHEAQKFTPEVDQFIRTKSLLDYVVAVGEIGLDYYYDNAPREVQKKAFENQLVIAADVNLPFQIHTRDAEQDTVDILNQFRGRVNGLIHCFTGTMNLAKQCLDLGFNISFSGIITFKNAKELREVVEYVPLDRMHVETDSPFLTPVPFRGRKNSPEMVVHTAEMVSKIKDVSMDELAAQMRVNASSMFTKIQW